MNDSIPTNYRVTIFSQDKRHLIDPGEYATKAAFKFSTRDHYSSFQNLQPQIASSSNSPVEAGLLNSETIETRLQGS
jgi:hypothetical protein